MSGSGSPHHPRGRATRALRALLGTALTFVALAAACHPPARAGVYELRACSYAGPLYFDARWEQYLNGRVDVVHNCDRQARGWVGIYQSRRGNSFAAGEGAGFRWYAPAGASFISSRVYGKLRNANGIAAQIYATNPDGGYYSLDANQPHDGFERQLYVDFSGAPRSQVAMRLACLTKPPCSNRAGDVKAFFEFREIFLQLRDSAPPTVQVGGELFGGSSVYRGVVGFSYGATDSGGGLWRAYAEVNGTKLELDRFSCPGAHSGFADRTQPCPGSVNRQTTFDTARAPFTEGTNRLRICAEDFATTGSSNVACSAWRHVTVDNLAPGPPQSLTVTGGAGWRAVNDFELTWRNPAPGATPIAGIRYAIEDADTGEVVQPAKELQRAGVESLSGIRVPRPGHFRVHLRLRDAAGNLGSSAITSLRFDDLRPGPVEAEPPPRWLAAGDFPFSIELRPPEVLGPSGLAGYAVAVGEDEDPCPEGPCQESEIVKIGAAASRTVRIERLSQGVHWLSAVAVSGAGLSSEAEHRVRLQVDLTEPETELIGLPEGWSRAPVTVTALAEDGESGMAPAPGSAHLPQTVIEVSGLRQWAQIGDRVTATLDRQGVHTVRHWARDVAGNANDGFRLANGYRQAPPGRATVKIDWTAPQVEFLPADPAHPERIRVKLTDRHSGPAGGAISYRPAGSSETPIRLPARFHDGLLEADFPSDELATGLYEVSAHGVDRAGNSSATADREPTILLPVPLKDPSAISLRFPDRPRAVRRRTKHGARTLVAGRLVDQEGGPLAATAVELIERFRPGSRLGQRVTTLTTDAEGKFRHRLKPGPSREIVARFAGSRLLARAESAPLRLAVRSVVSLKVKPALAVNGETVQMRGRVRGRGAAIPAKGKLVAIQYLDAGRRRWRPVELIRTGPKGRFRYGYQFSTVVSPRRFFFRAVAVTEAGWPYLAAHTPGQAVVVYPR